MQGRSTQPTTRDSAFAQCTLPTSENTVETRVWAEEQAWLHGLWKSGLNVAPRFRCPDLIGGCVAMVLGQPGGTQRLFHYLSTELVLRERKSPRREYVWADAHELLMNAQRSPANRHPHPMFQLDQLTTACVALARGADESGMQVLRQARVNMVRRAHRTLSYATAA
jgi:hypothetical protein